MFIHSRPEGRTILLVYVDDIVLTGDDLQFIQQTKHRLSKEFEMKDLGYLRYFLGIEVARSSKGIFISQRKYTLDLLKETGKLGSRPAPSPMEQKHSLHADIGDKLEDIGMYQRLVGKLIYLTITRPDITQAVSIVS